MPLRKEQFLVLPLVLATTSLTPVHPIRLYAQRESIRNPELRSVLIVPQVMHAVKVLASNVKVVSHPLVAPPRVSLATKEAYHHMEPPSAVCVPWECILFHHKVLASNVNLHSTVHKGCGDLVTLGASHQGMPPPVLPALVVAIVSTIRYTNARLVIRA